MARSPFVPMEETKPQQQVQAAAAAEDEGRRQQQPTTVGSDHQEAEAAVLLVHSQVRRIKREDEEARERLLKLRLLETRPSAAAAGALAWRAPRSLSPLRRASSTSAISVGE